MNLFLNIVVKHFPRNVSIILPTKAEQLQLNGRINTSIPAAVQGVLRHNLGEQSCLFKTCLFSIC